MRVQSTLKTLQGAADASLSICSTSHHADEARIVANPSLQVALNIAACDTATEPISYTYSPEGRM